MADKEEKDSKLSPETQILLDENFWLDATPQKVQELISKGADINAENKKGMTAAHFAALHSNLDVLKFLGENGADMNHGDIKAETPAHKVAKNENSNDILKELAKHNANFDQTNMYGESPRQMIQQNQSGAEPLLKEIEEIQQKKDGRENSDILKKESMNDRLFQGVKDGEDDSRNEENNPPNKENNFVNNKGIDPALLKSTKDY